MKAVLAWLLFAGISFSMPAAAEEPAEMLDLMRELGQRMDRISDGIWREDYAAIAEAARYIANHPKPPMKQRKKIIGALGTDAPDFRAGDKRVHETALAVVEAAQEKRMAEVAAHFGRLTQSCVDCHANFRDRLRPVLHPEQAQAIQ